MTPPSPRGVLVLPPHGAGDSGGEVGCDWVPCQCSRSSPVEALLLPDSDVTPQPRTRVPAALTQPLRSPLKFTPRGVGGLRQQGNNE